MLLTWTEKPRQSLRATPGPSDTELMAAWRSDDGGAVPPWQAGPCQQVRLPGLGVNTGSLSRSGVHVCLAERRQGSIAGGRTWACEGGKGRAFLPQFKSCLSSQWQSVCLGFYVILHQVKLLSANDIPCARDCACTGRWTGGQTVVISELLEAQLSWGDGCFMRD